MKTSTLKSTGNEIRINSLEVAKSSPLYNLFVNELKEVFGAELHLIESMPAIIAATSNIKLKSIFEEHLQTTQLHLKRLNETFNILDVKAEGRTCLAIEALIRECETLVRINPDSSTRDMAIISLTQKIEHFEIASYDCLRTFAKILGYEDAATLFQATLDEEEETEERLTTISEGRIKPVDKFLAYND